MPGMTLPFLVRGPDDAATGRRVIGYPVNHGFFDVYRLALVRGRLFTEDEAFADAPVAVLDARAAEALFPDQEPLGQIVADGARRRQWRVVGIVAGLATSPLRGSPTATAFMPIRHDSGRSWWVRYREPGGPALEDVRRVVEAVEPRALVTLGPAVDPISLQLAQPRFLATLLGTLAALALLLAAIGLTGVVSHAVGRRRREIGIRRALGADFAAVTRLVVARSLRPAVIGVIAGLTAARGASGLLSNQLHGIEPGDPATYLSAGVAGVVVAIIAAAAPARRAARVDPREVLMGE
jgi:hypothetical protein